MRKLFVCVLLALLAISFSGCSPDKEITSKEGLDEQEIVLSVLFGWPESLWPNDGFRIFEDIVEEKSEGRIKFNIIGGPEAVPTYEQLDALSNGLVDIIHTAADYYTDQAPGGFVLLLSDLTPEEERAAGVYDLLDGYFQQQANAKYLGRTCPIFKMRIYLKNPIEKASFEGLTLRSTPLWIELFDALGAAQTVTDSGEVYSALERGVVDGFAWPTVGLEPLGWHEQVDYVLDHEVYRTSTSIIINLDRWMELPEDVKQVLIESQKETEIKATQYNQKMYDAERIFLNEADIKFITLPPNEAEKFLELSKELGWKKANQMSPEFAPKMEEILRK